MPYPEPEAPSIAPHTASLTSYTTTSTSELPSRIKDAHIVITSTVKITASILSPSCSPNLLAVAAMAAGTDHVDLAAAKERGIVVFNCPHASSEVVANHALGLYFASRRRTVIMNEEVRKVPSEWKAKGSLVRFMRDAVGPPLVVGQEVAGIVGYGAIGASSFLSFNVHIYMLSGSMLMVGAGKRIANFAKALGMRVIVSARKGATTSTITPHGDFPRLPFSEVLRQSTVLFVLCPKTPDTTDLISTPELQTMNPNCVIVNIARGGIINESAIVSALRSGTVAGYATDVYDVEPAEGPSDSTLLDPENRDLNLTLTPHCAWFGERTGQNLTAMVKDNIEKFIQGQPQNVVT